MICSTVVDSFSIIAQNIENCFFLCAIDCENVTIRSMWLQLYGNDRDFRYHRFCSELSDRPRTIITRRPQSIDWFGNIAAVRSSSMAIMWTLTHATCAIHKLRMKTQTHMPWQTPFASRSQSTVCAVMFSIDLSRYSVPCWVWQNLPADILELWQLPASAQMIYRAAVGMKVLWNKNQMRCVFVFKIIDQSTNRLVWQTPRR